MKTQLYHEACARFGEHIVHEFARIWLQQQPRSSTMTVGELQEIREIVEDLPQYQGWSITDAIADYVDNCPRMLAVDQVYQFVLESGASARRFLRNLPEHVRNSYSLTEPQ